MMRIKSVYIDGLHNAINKTYQFNDMVYLFGHNGAGKSTVLQAIQFALLGYIPGTAKNSKEALLRHSPKGDITVELKLDDVTITRRVWKMGNRIDIDPVDYDIASIVQELELPIFNFNEFVDQTANKLKEYFIKNILPTTDGVLDWGSILSDSISDCNFEDRDEILKYGISLISGIDESEELLNQVIQANAKFKEEQSFNKSEIQRLQNTVDSLIYYDDYVGPTNLDDITSQITALSILRDQWISYNSAMDATKSVQAELLSLEEHIVTMGGQDAYELCNQELHKLHQRYTEVSDQLSKKQAELTQVRTKDQVAEFIIKSDGICPYTKENCKSIANKIEDLRNESVRYKGTCVTLTNEIDTLSGELNDTNLQIRKRESKISDFMKSWDRVTSLRKMTSDLPTKPDTDRSIYELNSEIDDLSKNKSKLEANIRYNDTIDNITKLKYDAELHNTALSCWVKKTDTNGLQTTLMQRPFENLAALMTTYIQQMYGNSDIKAHFNISTKANSFSFGLIRNSIYIPYDMLSSGEKCLYNLALMICIIHNNKSPLKVLLCDDMFDHLDSATIENTFSTLKGITDTQFIFAGVKDCHNAEDVMIRIG